MIRTLLSGDYPRSRFAAAILIVIVLALLLVPFVFPGARSLSVAAKVLVFVLLVASYDLLLGYTGIVSFAHTMFFGIGAYGVAIASTRMGPGWDAIVVGVVLALVLSALLAFAIGLFSLRVKAIFFAMITLAVAAAFQTLASQLSEFTGGEDGLSFKVPAVLQPSFELFEDTVLGASIDGRFLTYYLVFFSVLVLFLVLLRIVNSPFGRVLQAIRENDFRAEAIGYSAIFVLAQSYLQDLMRLVSGALEPVPLAAALFSPDRWLLWLGLLFVLSVYYFPTGIVGRLRARAIARTLR